MINIKTIFETHYNTLSNDDFLNWYLIYCYEANDQTFRPGDGLHENHHILPRGDFPEYANLTKNKWNSVRLSKSDHFIVHYLLVRAFMSSKSLYAFNQMRRVLPETDNIFQLSELYEEYRDSLSALFSTTNKGRVASAATKKKLSIANKGKIPVYNINDRSDTTRMDVNDLRYLSGEYVFIHTGKKHSEETKQKMSESGIGGYTRIYDIRDPSIARYIDPKEELPDGFAYGDPDKKEIASKRFKRAAHYHNPETEESMRIKPEDTIPDGFVKGRKYVNNPFSGKTIMKNFITGEIVRSETTHYPLGHGPSKAKFAILFEEKITFNSTLFLSVFSDKINRNTLNKIIQGSTNQICHYKMTPSAREYLKPYATYNEIPLRLIDIDEAIHLITSENWL